MLSLRSPLAALLSSCADLRCCCCTLLLLLLQAAGFVNKPELKAAALAAGVPAGLTDKFTITLPGAIKYCYATGIGPGATELPDSASLADADGMPIETKEAGSSGKSASSYLSPKVLAAAAGVAVVGVVGMCSSSRKP